MRRLTWNVKEQLRGKKCWWKPFPELQLINLIERFNLHELYGSRLIDERSKINQIYVTEQRRNVQPATTPRVKLICHRPFVSLFEIRKNVSIVNWLCFCHIGSVWYVNLKFEYWVVTQFQSYIEQNYIFCCFDEI